MMRFLIVAFLVFVLVILLNAYIASITHWIGG